MQYKHCGLGALLKFNMEKLIVEKRVGFYSLLEKLKKLLVRYITHIGKKERNGGGGAGARGASAYC